MYFSATFDAVYVFEKNLDWRHNFFFFISVEFVRNVIPYIHTYNKILL